MDRQDSPPLLTALARRIENPSDAGQVAVSVVNIWREINASLTPVLGERGVAEIYKRSLSLTTDYPWLMRMQQDVKGFIDLDALSRGLRAQSSGEACAAARALLESFYTLLTTLIGTTLTERLLRSVGTDSTEEINPSPQDPSS